MRTDRKNSTIPMRKLLLGIILMLSATVTFAQRRNADLPKANEEYKEKAYADAEANYRISQFKMPKQPVASYNLGNTIYRLNQPAEAKQSYLKTLENAKTKDQKHQAFHNLGNVFMSEKNYSQAVEAYKNALRNNPADEETRYNYALAKQYQKNNPDKDDKDKDKKDKDKDKDKDKKDDKKDGDKDKKDDKGKDDKDKKDKGDDKKDDKGDGKPNPQPKGGISKQQLENMLNAVNGEEKKVQEKVNAQKEKGKPVPTDKDW